MFEWKDTFRVKVQAFDTQHRKLFSLVSELRGAMAGGYGNEVAGDILNRLIDYTVHHFAAEERLMERYKFPGLPAHRAEHRALADKVLAFKKEFDAGIKNVMPELMTLLQQ